MIYFILFQLANKLTNIKFNSLKSIFYIGTIIYLFLLSYYYYNLYSLIIPIDIISTIYQVAKVKGYLNFIQRNLEKSTQLLSQSSTQASNQASSQASTQSFAQSLPQSLPELSTNYSSELFPNLSSFNQSSKSSTKSSTNLSNFLDKLDPNYASIDLLAKPDDNIQYKPCKLNIESSLQQTVRHLGI